MYTNWVCKQFSELRASELYAILQLRNEVFVVEQQCIFQDADNKDQYSYHLMCWFDDQLIAYARLLPPSTAYPEASIGRVVTAPASRKKGIGKELLERAVMECYRIFGKTSIRIGAQLYLRKFYELFGFRQTSEIYFEDGIKHIEMIL
jgi:ElaA protein